MHSSTNINRTIAKTISAIDCEEGAGVKLKRSLGINADARLDPFLMLDAFSSDNPDDYIAGFPAHPHRGFETVTYMLDGHMLHRDHMGNEGDLRSGGVQWMTAGRGVIHEETPKQVDGLLRGFQLWINLPAAEKMQPAAYQNVESEQVPEFQGPDGVVIRVIAGDIEIEGKNLQGPVSAPSTSPLYLDIFLPAQNRITLPVRSDQSAFLYLFEGDVSVEGVTAEKDAVTVLHKGEKVTLETQEQAARLLLLAGTPIGEPVVQYGPFVMNTKAEVEQAVSDYRSGCLTD